jgi:hypothetical protein
LDEHSKNHFIIQDHAAVVDILVRELGKELMQPIMRQGSVADNQWSQANIPSNSEELVKYAKDVATRYRTARPGDGISEQRRTTLQTLAKLHEFRYYYIYGVAEQALEVCVLVSFELQSAIVLANFLILTYHM